MSNEEMIEKYGVSLEELTDIYVNGVINSELSEEKDTDPAGRGLYYELLV